MKEEYSTLSVRMIGVVPMNADVSCIVNNNNNSRWQLNSIFPQLKISYLWVGGRRGKKKRRRRREEKRKEGRERGREEEERREEERYE